MKCSKFYKTISVLILSLVLSIFLYLLFSDRHGSDKPPPIAVNNYMSSTDTCSTGGTTTTPTSTTGGSGGGSGGGGGGSSSAVTLPPFIVRDMLIESESIKLSDTGDTIVDVYDASKQNILYRQTDDGSVQLQNGDMIWYSNKAFIVTEVGDNITILHISDTIMDMVEGVLTPDATIEDLEFSSVEETGVFRNVLSVENDAMNNITLQPGPGQTLNGPPVILVPDLTGITSQLTVINKCGTMVILQLPYPYHATLINENGESSTNITESTEVYLDKDTTVVIKPAGTPYQLEFRY